MKENLAAYETELKMCQRVVKQLVDKYKAIFIPFQDAFNKALQKAPGNYWIWDGIHFMPAGHELMARERLKYVRPKLDLLDKKNQLKVYCGLYL